VLEWFSALSTPLMIFYSLAIFASLILVIQIVLFIFGIGDDLDMVDMDSGEGLGFLSVRSITGFLGGFGWTGVIALESGLSAGLASLLGIVVGGGMMISVAFLMKTLYSLRESGNIDYSTAIGKVGTVYLPIPPDQSGPGQIRIMVQGRLKVVPAYTESKKTIPSQQKVWIVGLLDPRTFLVEPNKPSSLSEEKE
jgi:hypothetical protein